MTNSKNGAGIIRTFMWILILFTLSLVFIGTFANRDKAKNYKRVDPKLSAEAPKFDRDDPKKKDKALLVEEDHVIVYATMTNPDFFKTPTDQNTFAAIANKCNERLPRHMDMVRSEFVGPLEHENGYACIWNKYSRDGKLYADLRTVITVKPFAPTTARFDYYVRDAAKAFLKNISQDANGPKNIGGVFKWSENKLEKRAARIDEEYVVDGLNRVKTPSVCRPNPTTDAYREVAAEILSSADCAKDGKATVKRGRHTDGWAGILTYPDGEKFVLVCSTNIPDEIEWILYSGNEIAEAEKGFIREKQPSKKKPAK